MKKSASSLTQHASRFAQRVQSHIASLCSGASANACSCGYFAKIYSYFRKFSSIILRRPGKVSLENVKAHRFNIFFTAPHTAKAFTMAEAIIVMTILGIIATIMITNLKIAEYRDKGLQIQAKKVLEQIDQATQHILMNDSFDGKMSQLYDKNKNLFSFKDDCAKGVELYKKYISAKRSDFVPTCYSSWCHWIDSGDEKSRFNEFFFLKDGAFVGFLCASSLDSNSTMSSYYPGEIIIDEPYSNTGTYVSINTNNLVARIVFDVNGTEGPNITGKDIFKIPLADTGIIYDPK